MMFSRSVLSVLAVTSSTASIGIAALSVHHAPAFRSSLASAPPPAFRSSSLLPTITTSTLTATTTTTTSTTTTALKISPRKDDITDYGRDKQTSELDSLISKRDQIRQSKLANTKPDDDSPKVQEMSDEEIQAMFNKDGSKKSEKGGGGGSKGSEAAEGSDDAAAADGSSSDASNNLVDVNVNDLFSKDYVPEFKTKRSSSSRGLSSGDAGGVFDDPDADEAEAIRKGMFVDWTEDYDDENEFHVPNRMGFTTRDWGDGRKGFVGGKLKKKERKGGKFNKADLRKAYEKLEQNGISFVETSESSSFAEAFLQKFMEECEHGDNDRGALVASTFPNPWKHALKSKSLPRHGAKALVSAAEESCDRMGISSMTLYQVQNPWYYIGGSTAMAEGMLDVISDDHSRYAGCIDMSLSKLAKLQRKLMAQGEFLATNQFEFSLTDHKGLGMIQACKKLGITPVCTNVLDGGLATGKYTSVNPTGGEVSKGEGDMGPFPVRKLEKLDALFKVQDGMREKINHRIGNKMVKLKESGGQTPKINQDVTTTQIAINYVRAKGAVPLVAVNNLKMANELLGCLGWELSDEEVEELDKACKSCGV